VSVNQIGVPARTANGRAHREEHERSPPRTLAERGRDVLGAAEAAIRTRSDDGDLDSALAQPFHEVGDEAPGEVVLVPRIRGREDGDLQSPASLLAEILVRLHVEPHGEEEKLQS
jgi:hypothetical protein